MPKKPSSFRNKMLTLGIALTAGPLSLFGIVVGWQDYQLRQTASRGCLRAAEADVDHIAQSVYRLCEDSRAALEHNVRENLFSARALLDKAGLVRLDYRAAVTWQAKNQFTKATSSISLPKLLVGNQWLGQENDAGTPVPVVDTIRTITKATSTIFERMDQQGDMLRIATNVIGSDGKRAIGTFIPAVAADGQPNPVISTVLRGETFVGRAFVVNAWYMAAYEPLFDGEHNVIGMLYVGVPEAFAEGPLRDAIKNITVGKTGYVYVLNATGAARGHYVVSKGGTRDGEDIWNVKDGDGKLFIQDICKRALALTGSQMFTYRYHWKNPIETGPYPKIARITYFKHWDWVIGVSVPESEMYETVTAVDRISRNGAMILTAMGLLILATSCATWYFVGNRLTSQTDKIIQRLTNTSKQVSSAAVQLSSASQELAVDAKTQAASSEKITDLLSRMGDMAQQNLAHSRVLKELATRTRSAVEDGAVAVHEMSETTQQIQSAGSEVVNINKVIAGIAFQTNLLALNAAVEAARAGDAGLGFAVVADEVRALAHRSSQAVRDTSEKIERSIAAGDQSVAITQELAAKLSTITANTRKLDDLVQSVELASEQQNRGIGEINTAAALINKGIRSTAQSAEIGAKRADQFTVEARTLASVATELSGMFQS